MEYIVTRTSVNRDGKPCESAYRVKVLREDRRTVDSPDKLMYFEGSPTWYQMGHSHGVKDGNIVRYFDSEAWAVTIGSLEELVAFNREHGDLVVHGSLWYVDKVQGAPLPSIEIYDDYRE